MGIWVRTTNAGDSAEREYRERRFEWQMGNKSFQRLRVVLFGLAALFVGVSLLWARYFALGSWGLGMLTGSALTFLIFVVNHAPPKVENWQAGAFAERETAQALKPLEKHGWKTVHDLQREEGRNENTDHVVIGPGGIFLLDTKLRRDDVETTGTSIRIGGWTNNSMAKDIRRQGIQMTARLRSLGLPVAEVQPVIVFWAKFPQRVSELYGFTCVHGSSLCEWLESRDRVLTDEQVDAAYRFISALPSAASQSDRQYA